MSPLDEWRAYSEEPGDAREVLEAADTLAEYTERLEVSVARTQDELARELRALMDALPDIVRDSKSGSGEGGDHHDGESIAREVERRLWGLVVRLEVE